MNEYLAIILGVEMILIGACAVVQRGMYRVIVASIFAFLMVAHYEITIVFDIARDFQYLLAGSFNFCTIFFISNLEKTPKLAVDIAFVSLILIAVNAVGCLLEWIGMPYFIYGSMLMILYGFAILKLTKGDNGDGDYKDDALISILRSNLCTGHTVLHGH